MKRDCIVLCLFLLLGHTVFAQKISVETNRKLTGGKIGSIIEVPEILSMNIPLVDFKKSIMPGPQFLISDDPEYIRIPEAIAMQEQVDPGAVRLYVYNVNGVEQPRKMQRKITAVIKNLGKEQMQIRMLKYSSQKPSTNYFQIGKQGLADYFLSTEIKNVRTVKPGEVIAIDEQLEKRIVNYDELVHGFYEFVVDQPALISILQTAPEKTGPQAFAAIDTIIPFSHVNAGRGIFPVSNYKITNTKLIDTKDGAMQLIVADGEADPWIVGTIGNKKEEAKNAGNYGVLYHTKLKWKSTGGKGLALITWNSRSANGQWCGGMGMTMTMFNQYMKATVRQYPSDRLVTKGMPEAILLEVYRPDPNKELQEIDFIYSPPGASCLPTPLILVPVDL